MSVFDGCKTSSVSIKSNFVIIEFDLEKYPQLRDTTAVAQELSYFVVAYPGLNEINFYNSGNVLGIFAYGVVNTNRIKDFI